MNTNSKRIDYLDNLKVFLIIMVVLHHAGQAYGDGGFWGYTPSNPTEYEPWLWRFFSVNASFLMGLFFFISGFFVPLSYDRQGPVVFLKKKLMRLGIPLVVMVSFLTAYNGFTWIDMGPMWFIEHLLFYCIIYIVIRLIANAIKRPYSPPAQITAQLKSIPTLIFIIIIAAVISLLSYLSRSYSAQDSWIWLFGFLKTEPAHLPQYVLMFSLGIPAYRYNWLHRLPKSVGIICLSIAMSISCIIWFAPIDSSLLSFVAGKNIAVTDSAICVFMSIGLVWLFREVMNFSNSFLKWCSDQAFGIYFFHCALMVTIQTITDKLYLGGGIEKALFIGITTLIISAILTYLLKLIPGVKKVL